MMNTQSLWRRWVAANALGEMFGLGATFAVGALAILGMQDQQGVGVVLATFAVAVGSGVIEATVIGLAQWWAMHPWFPGISRRAWWLATLAGALIAYVLGYLPSTIMSLGEQMAESPAPMAEPPQWAVLLLAAGMGAIGGVVLSFAQWLVLRKNAPGATIWIPANMLAWAAGMPVIFWGIDLAQKMPSTSVLVLVMAFSLLLAGAIVGAVHGWFLVRIAEQAHSSPTTG